MARALFSSERRSMNMNPTWSPTAAAVAALTLASVAKAPAPLVSMAALTDVRSPAIATLPPTRAKAPWALGMVASLKTVSSVPW